MKAHFFILINFIVSFVLNNSELVIMLTLNQKFFKMIILKGALGRNK